jgi:hypothetical protein
VTEKPIVSSNPFPDFLFFETESQYVAQAGLELNILQPVPPECWDYRCVPLCLLLLYRLEK